MLARRCAKPSLANRRSFARPRGLDGCGAQGRITTEKTLDETVLSTPQMLFDVISVDQRYIVLALNGRDSRVSVSCWS